jgi:hypothetical protein
MNDRSLFIASAGRSFRQRSSCASDLLTYVGFQFVLGGEEEQDDE